MARSLDGKVALVTGASRGIGVALAEHPELVEPVAWLAEAVLALATCDPRHCTGRVLYSGPFLDEIGRKRPVLPGGR